MNSGKIQIYILRTIDRKKVVHASRYMELAIDVSSALEARGIITDMVIEEALPFQVVSIVRKGESL